MKDKQELQDTLWAIMLRVMDNIDDSMQVAISHDREYRPEYLAPYVYDPPRLIGHNPVGSIRHRLTIEWNERLK